MPRQVESERSLQLRDSIVSLRPSCLVELLEGGIRVLDVRRVMLAVVQLHDARRDVRLERRVVELKLRKSVIGHSLPLSSLAL